jgi:hypothetical protein
MYRFFIGIIWMVCISSHVQAQLSPDQIKTNWIGQTWKIIQYETFGITEEPSPEKINDKLLLRSDMSFLIIENSKSYTGKYTLQTPYFTCQSTDKTWSKTYKIISIEESKSTIEYKDPDLTKTLYYLVKE